MKGIFLTKNYFFFIINHRKYFNDLWVLNLEDDNHFYKNSFGVGSIPEIEEYFINGKELVTYDTFEDLVEKAEYYLKHPQERRLIAKAGKKKVIELFSYHNALDAILIKSEIK